MVWLAANKEKIFCVPATVYWCSYIKKKKKKDEANKKFNYHSLFYLPRRWFTWMQKQPNQIKLASAIWLMDYEQKPEIL